VRVLVARRTYVSRDGPGRTHLDSFYVTWYMSCQCQYHGRAHTRRRYKSFSALQVLQGSLPECYPSVSIRLTIVSRVDLACESPHSQLPGVLCCCPWRHDSHTYKGLSPPRLSIRSAGPSRPLASPLCCDLGRAHTNHSGCGLMHSLRFGDLPPSSN
jgi:hypothetical protein